MFVDPPLDERVDAARDAVDAVVDEREVEDLLLAAVDRDWLVPRQLVHEQGQHALHPPEVVVETSVDVREPEDEVVEAVAAGVRVDERLAGDLRRRVRALRVCEVGGLLRVLLEAVNVAVHLAGRREHERQPERARVLEDVERHDRVLERPVRLPDELVHLRVRGQVHHGVDLRVLDPADPAGKRRIVAGEILQQGREGVGPRVEPLVDAEDVVAVTLQPKRKVGADLARRAGDEDPHAVNPDGRM